MSAQRANSSSCRAPSSDLGFDGIGYGRDSQLCGQPAPACGEAFSAAQKAGKDSSKLRVLGALSAAMPRPNEICSVVRYGVFAIRRGGLMFCIGGQHSFVSQTLAGRRFHRINIAAVTPNIRSIVIALIILSRPRAWLALHKFAIGRQLSGYPLIRTGASTPLRLDYFGVLA